MAQTKKEISALQGQQTLREAFNSVDSSLTQAEYLVGKVGRRKDYAVSATTVTGDTVTITYSEDGVTLYVIRKIYTDGNRTQLLSEERIS